ncbi:MAG: 50S ribosomal protein L23 [Candidatus Paceibacterota bacterium]
MALFSQKTAKKKAASAPKKEKKAEAILSSTRDLSSVLRAPRVTEKAMRGSERNVYVFEVARSATKFDVRDAVKQFFNVTPVKINIVNKSPRQFKSASTRRVKTEHGMKKAYVYLKKGDSISLM